MNSIIKLTGIKTIGRHGVEDGEQDKPQTFYVDIEMTVSLAEDSIGSTVDYRETVELVRRIVEQKNFNLIETMAEFIAKKIYQSDKVNTVKVVIHKPAAAQRLLAQDVTTEAYIKG